MFTNDDLKYNSENGSINSLMKEQLLNTIIDNLYTPFILLQNQQIIAANKRAQFLFKTQHASDLIGKSLLLFSSEKQGNGKLSSVALNESLKKVGISNELVDWKLRTLQGNIIESELSFKELSLNNQTFILTEIFETGKRKRVERKLKEKTKEIESLSEERESLNEELRATLDELVEVNKQLSESETWNKSIVENIPLGLMVLNLDNQIEYINDSLFNILGYSVSELEGEHMLNYALSYERPRLRKFFIDFKNKRNLNEIEYWIKTKSGEQKFIKNLYVNLGNDGRWMIITTDLTNEKNKEILLTSAHDRLELAINSNDSIIWDIDLEKHADKSGKIFGNLFGYGPNELKINKDLWFDITHPDDLPGVMEELMKNLHDEIPNYEVECRILSKEGEWKWVISRGRIIKNPDTGKPQRFIGMFIDIERRKKAEILLSHSEERFRAIIQHLTDIIFIVDKEMNLIYESPSVSRLFGFEPGYFVGKNSIEFIHPDDIEIVHHEFSNVIERKNDYKPTEIRVRHRDSKWRWVEIIGDNLLEHPAIKGILVTARDITERKENEMQLRLYRNHLEKLVKERTEEIELINSELLSINQTLSSTNEELAEKNAILNNEIAKRIQAQLLMEESENKFRSFIEQSTEGISLIDEEGRIIEWNKTMESIYRINKEEILNKYAWEFDYRFLPERRKTPEQFEQLKNSILEYLSFDNPHKVMTVEGAFYTMEMKQKFLNVTIFPVITTKRKYVGRIVRDITSLKRAQEEIQKQSEELKFINENLEEQKNQLESTLSELKKTQSQLIQSEKMASLGVLTAGVAHEINNPVNYINSGLEGLKITLADWFIIFNKYEELTLTNAEKIISDIDKLKKELDFNSLQEGMKLLLTNMQTGIERITEIVKSLRTFARVEENEFKTSSIHELLDTTLIMLHNQYKNRIEIVKQYGEIPQINCYAGKLSQVFMNLLSNAIQAIFDKGKIFISTKHDKHKHQVIISIKDTGPGIPDDKKEKIFEPFFTTKEAGKGTGLGLSISYGIIQQHNGSIEVNSKKDEGAEFIIRIPSNLGLE